MKRRKYCTQATSRPVFGSAITTSYQTASAFGLSENFSILVRAT